MSPARTVVVVRRPAASARPKSRPAARRRPAKRRAKRPKPRFAQWWPAVLVAIVVLVGFAWDADGDDVPMATAECTLPTSGVHLTGEQIANARTIAQVAWDRGLPERAVVIALATAMQESGLRNLDYGDRDSLGLFQQRPSQGWGTPEQVQDPVYAAGKFYDHLVTVPDWQTGDLSLTADAVQRSAFPLAYGRWSGMAEELTGFIAAENNPCS